MARIDDGHSTRIDFYPTAFLGLGGSLLSAIHFWEKEVTPPSIDGGGPNDTTTMRNVTWRTKAPKKLKTLDSFRAKVSYDPSIYAQAVTAINLVNRIRVIFPDGQRLYFWGWLDKITPDPVKEGEQPTAEIVIECGNQNREGVIVAPQIKAANAALEADEPPL